MSQSAAEPRWFTAEPDPEFDGQFLVVEVSDDHERDGTIIGYVTCGFGDGPGSLQRAEAVAAFIEMTQHQPDEAASEVLGYTAKSGEEF